MEQGGPVIVSKIKTLAYKNEQHVKLRWMGCYFKYMRYYAVTSQYKREPCFYGSILLKYC
jgi:hypothetical protein